MSKLELLNTEEIELDLENPRIAKFLEIYSGRGEITRKQIIQALSSGLALEDSDENTTTYRTLQESIRTNRGLINPIIVNKNGNKYTVVEGNTRLAIYKELEDQKAPGDWSRIPALIYDKMSPKDIDGIRLQAHLVGVRAWDPYSKAKYLTKLLNVDHLTWNEVIDFCGGKKEEARRYVAAYQDMEMYYKPLVDNFKTNQFSGFVELQKRNIKEAIAMHGFDLSDFAQWIIDEKLKPLRTIRKIPAILDNPRAKEVFLKKGAREAEKILDAESISTGIDLEKIPLKELANILTSRFRKMEKETLNEYRRQSDHPDLAAFQDLKDELIDTFELIERD